VTSDLNLTKQTAPAPPPAGGDGPAGTPRASWVASLHLATFARTAVPLVAIIVGLSLYTNSQNSQFLSSGNIQDLLGASAVLGLLAIGQTFLLVGGQLDLSVGSVVSFIGVLAAKEYASGWSSWAVIVSCLALGALIGLLWGVIVVALRVPPFILTLGGLGIFSSVALVIANNRPIPQNDHLNTLGFGNFLGLRAATDVWIVAIIVAIVLLHFTRFGRSSYALGSSPQAAFLAGVPTKRLTVSLYVLNSTLAALAGIVLMSRLAAGDPRGGAGLELQAIAAIVLGGAALAGGRGSIIGSTLGVLVFGVVNVSLTFLNIAGAWQQLVSGGILVAAVTLTAAADMYSARRSGGQSANRVGQLWQRMISRPPRPPDKGGSA
jgi:ribose/xylose/arabinose/galactoside ABC-type transport system permease subunit